MSHQVSKQTVTIELPDGLHLRPADAFVSLAKTFASEVQLAKGAESVDGKSILAIITLAAAKGEELLVRAEGPDAEEAVEQLVHLVQRNFDVALANGPDDKDPSAGNESDETQPVEN